MTRIISSRIALFQNMNKMYLYDFITTLQNKDYNHIKNHLQ